ncbi:hypothetical protein CAPTEDRAFT_197652 [Capitella teleta]|uniref:SUEL-type lectin domain-containing protein n=1 Tax=Capitella teleta TaxID=283909 RepID=R7VHF7_CAPTE|nr:hypothetical protein CAPTEDRAFT_197652 [Capitella teleta]|eukprot:ELU18012.1 hypothetical protein CAPTEDRAFT_197652 [Capitella teleta]
MASIGVEMMRLFAVILVGFNEITSTDALQEVCNAKDFNAQCGRGEIIVMKSANLGRMRLGNCVTQDFGYLGCQSSVISRLDTVCTGKNECRMRKIAKEDFEDTVIDSPCPGDLGVYLEADYECVKVKVNCIITFAEAYD